MAYPKRFYPRKVYGLMKDGLGYCLCSFEVNDQRRIKFIEKEPPELLAIVIRRLAIKAENDILNEPSWDDYMFEDVENGETKNEKN